jgi:hypothetical protein
MRNTASLLLLVLVIGCAKHKNACSLPTFGCLQGNWIAKEPGDSASNLKEYIQVYLENDREILYDWTYVAQLSTTQVALGKYYFAELPDQDSVALTPVWEDQTIHRYLKMINENEIEIDYLQQTPIFKKIYIRE